MDTIPREWWSLLADKIENFATLEWQGQVNVANRDVVNFMWFLVQTMRRIEQGEK